jgi:hypothetical protein
MQPTAQSAQPVGLVRCLDFKRLQDFVVLDTIARRELLILDLMRMIQERP